MILAVIVPLLALVCGSLFPIHAYQERERIQSNVKDTKERLLIGLNRAIERLTLIKNELENNRAVPLEKKEQIVSEIDERIAFLEGKREEVKNATTSFELKNIVLELREAAERKYKLRFMNGWGRRIVDKTKRAYQLAEKVYEKLDKEVKKLEAEGKEVKSLEAKLEDAKNYINDANNKFQMAEEMLRSFDEDKPQEWLKEMHSAHEYVKEGMDALKRARDLMNEVWKEVKLKFTSRRMFPPFKQKSGDR